MQKGEVILEGSTGSVRLSRAVASESAVLKRLLTGSFKEGDSSSVRSNEDSRAASVAADFQPLVDQAIKVRKQVEREKQ